MENFNLHNKKGKKVYISQNDIEVLNNNQNFHLLMDWVEGNLRRTKMIMSPEFFHPSFSKRDKEVIISMIYTIYDVVTDITPMGENGCIIISKDFLTKTTL
jgi:hypothetical protein